jgi:cytochrome c553
MRRFVTLAGLLLLVAGCATSQITLTDLPSGDAVRGSALFKQSINGAPECASCHTTDGSPLTGPSFQGFAARADTRISGLSGHDYAFQSIANPPGYLVSGFDNLMYNQYAQRLNAQQIADLIAYLLTL